MPPKTSDFATQEGVLIMTRDNEPRYMAVKMGGRIEYFRIRPASWQDHVDMNKAQMPTNGKPVEKLQ